MVLSLLAVPAHGSLYTQNLGSLSPSYLASKLAGPGVTISNVTYQGRSWSAGTFYGGVTSVGFDSGVVLCTGNVEIAEHPNTLDNAGSSNGMPGDADLDALAGTTTKDATVLEFDFVTTDPLINFSFVFASEEYNEYVGSWNDAFAFYLDGENIATLPGTSTPISINTINRNANSAWFVDNDRAIGAPVQIEYDGLTREINLSRSVSAGVTHHIKFAIADGGDDRNDSAVFLKGSSFSTGQHADLYVEKYAPEFVAAGGTIRFDIVAGNNGTATAENVVLWDTVPPGTTLVAVPSGATLTNGILVWDLGSLAPNDYVWVDFEVTVDSGGAAIVNAVGSCGRDAGGGEGGGGAEIESFFSEPCVTEVQAPVPDIMLWVMADKSGPVCVGEEVRYTLMWSNNGTGTALNLTMTNELPGYCSYKAASFELYVSTDWLGEPVMTSSAFASSGAGPWTPGELPGGSVSPATMRWAIDRVAPGQFGMIDYSVVVGPALSPSGYIENGFTGTITGDTEVLEAWPAQTGTAGTLGGSLSISATTIETGAPALVTAALVNTGCVNLTGVAPSVLAITGGSATASGPSVPSVPSLAPGDTAIFTWTMTADTPGIYYIDCTGTGVDPNTGDTVSTGPLSVTRVQVIRAPTLTVGIAGSPAGVCPGESQLVVLNVSNTGAVAATGVTPSIPIAAGNGAVGPLAGPWPAVVPILNGGGVATFTWTVTGVSAGALAWSATVTAVDSFAGLPLPPAGGTGASVVWSTPVLKASLSAPPSSLLSKWVTVCLTVTEGGGAPVTGLTAAGPAAGLPVQLISGPSPAIPASLPAGGSLTFTWTYSISGAGTMHWSATVQGTGCSGAIAGAPAAAATTVPRPAILAARITVSASVVVEGQPVVCVLTISNTGDTAALTTVPSAGWNGPVSGLLAGPSPVASSVPAGGCVSFTWTLSTSGTGPLLVWGGAAGIDASLGWPVSSPIASATLFVVPGAQLVIDCFEVNPKPGPAGNPVTVTLCVRNTGGAAADVTGLVAGVISSPADTAGPPGAVTPGLPFTIPPMSATRFTWTVPTTVCGSVRMTVTLNGVEVGTGRVLGPLFAQSQPSGLYAAPATLRFLRDQDTAVCKSDIEVAVVVEDGCGNAIAGANVDMLVRKGGATPPSAALVTDGSGIARIKLHMGLDAGPNELKATVHGTTIFSTGVVTATLPAGALEGVGGALDRNVFAPDRGEVLGIRLFPVTEEPVVIRIYTASGRLIRVITESDSVGGGRWLANWDGMTGEEAMASPGVYIVRITGGGISETLKVVVR